jgi:catechol 2,3-dioxygenase-like lactoylglutathione lyase family enzyme
MTVRRKLVGINHVALEVGDIDEALDLYASLFEFELRGRIGNRMAFIDMGDQFLALSAGRSQPPDQARHFGLVVDDKEAVREAVKRAGLKVSGPRGGSLDFLDPWGNQIQVVDYREVSPRPIRTSLTSSAGKRPWSTTPGTADSRAASSAGSATSPW